MRFDTGLAVRSPQTIRAGIPSPNNHDTFAFGRNFFALYRITRDSLILLGKVIHRQMDPLKISAWNGKLSWLFSPHRQQDRIIIPTQFL
jgi:hypothetical protein